MKKLNARQPTLEERKELEEGLKSGSVLTVRRCQMILLSADEQLTVKVIGQRVGRSGQTVRDVINNFTGNGIACIYPQPIGRQDDQRAFNDQARERLREMIRSSPRDWGQDTSLWTLDLIAVVSFEQGIVGWHVHKDTISETLIQMGLPWKRAKKTIQSPDPNYESKKNDEIG